MPFQVGNGEMEGLLERVFIRRNDPAEHWAKTLGAFSSIESLISLWPMNHTQLSTGNTFDLIANQNPLVNNGTVTRATDSTRLVSYASFDGATQWFNRADNASNEISGSLFLGGWFWFDATGTMGLISKWTELANNRAYRLFLSAGTYSFSVSTDGTAVTTVNSSVAFQANAWHLILGRYTPSTEMAIFVDGVESDNTSSIPASINVASTAILEVGRSNGTNYLDGRISIAFLANSAPHDGVPFALYNKTRSAYR